MNCYFHFYQEFTFTIEYVFMWKIPFAKKSSNGLAVEYSSLLDFFFWLRFIQNITKKKMNEWIISFEMEKKDTPQHFIVLGFWLGINKKNEQKKTGTQFIIHMVVFMSPLNVIAWDIISSIFYYELCCWSNSSPSASLQLHMWNGAPSWPWV